MSYSRSNDFAATAPSGSSRVVTHLLALVLILLASPATAQFEDDGFRSGLVGRYRQHETAFKQVDACIAFAWGAETPDRRLAAEGYEVRWRGYLMAQAPGVYRLSASVVGEVEIELAGEVVLTARSSTPRWFESEELNLAADFHPLEVQYRKTGKDARVVLFWSGPQFQLEPVGGRYLFHDPTDTPDERFERGRRLTRALRCIACHEIPGEPEVLAAPSLVHLEGAVHYQWLVERLQSEQVESSGLTARKMPHFGLTAQDARAIADYLFAKSTPAAEWSPPQQPRTGRKRGSREKVDPVQAGRQVLLTVGCLACHSLGEVGSQGGEFGGGDLAKIAGKRPARFFEQWLAAPETINVDHRMPVFDLTREQRRQLSAFLATLGDEPPARSHGESLPGSLTRGRDLIEKLRCSSCHRLPGAEVPARSAIPLPSNTEAGCLDAPLSERHRPGFFLTAEQREAVSYFLAEVKALPQARRPWSAEQFIEEQNCLACHSRDGRGGISDLLTRLSATYQDLMPLIPAMIPPALDQVGDKFRRKALDAVIRRAEGVHRDYLAVRMPHFRLNDDQRSRVVDFLITTDRIPAEARARRTAVAELDSFTRDAAGRRLVTADGFGCTSCHQIGSVRPVAAPLNTRGPDIAMCGERIRREWFDRFVSNPARVVPAMEMPSVRLAVRGVLGDDLHQQLSVVWDVLNQPGFEPPRPNPIRVLRHSGQPTSAERAFAITDVLRTADAVHIKPLLVGLPNRHNVLFDLETGGVAYWSIGDTARQRTEGKTWFWEAAGSFLLDSPTRAPDVTFSLDGSALEPLQVGQFATEIDRLSHLSGGVELDHRLYIRDREATRRVINVTQRFSPLHTATATGFGRRVEVENAPPGAQLHLQAVPPGRAGTAIVQESGQVLRLRDGASVYLRAAFPETARWNHDGSVTITLNSEGKGAVAVEYWTDLTVDHFPVVSPPVLPNELATLNVVPGFDAIRLSLSAEIMPTALAWRPNGDLVIASLKGRVWIAQDTDGDELEDRLEPFSDELAAPYGLAASEEYIDVITKYALLRMYDDDGDGRVDRTRAVASGWGHTDDYHDWAVGLPRDRVGNYYVALPCQQDERSPAAAHLRGTVLRLAPQEPTAEDPREYSLEELTAGHRFPMGIALRKDGELFVTDNQGNYNPFNELNHVVHPRRFGFINSLERRPGFNPVLTPPAIDIPHPWTRSVNGICFLDTPAELAGQGPFFGPFEGHLLGCEMDSLRLVRMTLQEIDGEFQGAAYPFSYDQPQGGLPFLGPLTCAVAPDGEIYVGGLRDSGWGGGNNIGEIVRLRPHLDELPCGIAEVRAVATGLILDFTAPVDPSAASDPANYAVSTYTRVSTPAYGGDDQQRRSQPIDAVQVAADARSVQLQIARLRAGHVYEIHLKNLAADGKAFFPAEAHYTMRRVPQDRSLTK